MNGSRHRHESSSWLICSGYILWCYQCGAFRKMRMIGSNGVVPDGDWIKPTGIGGENPWKPSMESSP